MLGGVCEWDRLGVTDVCVREGRLSLAEMQMRCVGDGVREPMAVGGRGFDSVPSLWNTGDDRMFPEALAASSWGPGGMLLEDEEGFLSSSTVAFGGPAPSTIHLTVAVPLC